MALHDNLQACINNCSGQSNNPECEKNYFVDNFQGNINNIRTIFDFLVEKFDFVLSISHLSQIKEHCSSQIHLKKNDKGYSIIV